MNIEWIERTDKDDDGRSFPIHFLVDMESHRAYGYVEGPSEGTNQILYIAVLYGTEEGRRFYISPESAKNYLEEMCMRIIAEESNEFAEEMRPKRKAKRREPANLRD